MMKGTCTARPMTVSHSGIDAGAALVQIYTGYIYNGPGYVREICRALLEKKAAEN